MAGIINSVTPFPDDMMKKYKWLDEYLQEKPATEKEFQAVWQAYKYSIRGKMYAYIGIQDQIGRPIITLKLEPEFSNALRQEYDDIIPGYYMNKIHWSTVYLDGEVPQELLSHMVDTSHKLLLSSLSKKAQKEILGE